MAIDSKTNIEDNLILEFAGKMLKTEDLGKNYCSNPQCLKCSYIQTFSNTCYSCDKISWNALCTEEGAW